jgi:hypothetical protein
MELGVHAGEWSALPCGSAAPPAERDYPLAKGSNNTHRHTHTVLRAYHLRTESSPGSLSCRAHVAYAPLNRVSSTAENLC